MEQRQNFVIAFMIYLKIIFCAHSKNAELVGSPKSNSKDTIAVNGLSANLGFTSNKFAIGFVQV